MKKLLVLVISLYLNAANADEVPCTEIGYAGKTIVIAGEEISPFDANIDVEVRWHRTVLFALSNGQGGIEACRRTTRGEFWVLHNGQRMYSTCFRAKFNQRGVYSFLYRDVEYPNGPQCPKQIGRTPARVIVY